jgi:excisionase family DNA binding protein
MTSSTWPWPADSREDRARRIALSYRRLIELALTGDIDNPATALADLDTKWQELGQTWITPTQQPLRLDDWLTPAELAELLGIDARSFRDWARRGHIRAITTAGTRRYCVGDIVTYGAKRRRACAILTPGPLCPKSDG